MEEVSKVPKCKKYQKTQNVKKYQIKKKLTSKKGIKNTADFKM